MAINSLPASTSLLNEINFVGKPNRNKAQDGTIGDAAHASQPSDHNPDESGQGEDDDADNIDEVHARDVDARGPWKPGWSMARIVGIVLARCRSGVEKRLRYIIFDEYIYEADNGWKKRYYGNWSYNGRDPHTEHSHWSFKYGSGSGTSNPENITSAWGIRAAEEEDMPTVKEIVDEMENRLADPNSDLFKSFRAISWKYPISTGANGESALKVFTDMSAEVTQSKADINGLKNDASAMKSDLAAIKSALGVGGSAGSPATKPGDPAPK